MWWDYRAIRWRNKNKFKWERAVCKTQNFYIVLAFLLIIRALLIPAGIHCYLIKYQAIWLCVQLRTKWLWVQIPLLWPKLQIPYLIQSRSSLTFRQTIKCGLTLKPDMIKTHSTKSYYYFTSKIANLKYQI